MGHAPPDHPFCSVRRRYRLAERMVDFRQVNDVSHAAALAFAIEQARLALERGDPPDDEWKQIFLSALAAMIREAMDEKDGDLAFQTVVLRHRIPHLREYASLSAQASQDRRTVHALVNRVAHPEKLQRTPQSEARAGLELLHVVATSQAWHDLHARAEAVAFIAEAEKNPVLAADLKELHGDPALSRLMRLLVLSEDPLVQHYQSLWGRQGPRAGSSAAIEQGTASQRRGADVEASVAKALSTWAQCLNQNRDRIETFRVVTSMRVPATIPGNADRAKSEWDVVILKRPTSADVYDGSWELCFLVEAKASVDAAVTDFPRLLRGLRLLGKADPAAEYPFQTQEGTVLVCGASLNRVGNSADVGEVTLYCCDAPAEASARVLNPASRMQLLSAPESLRFASELVESDRPDSEILEPLWSGLLTAPKWRSLLYQYPTLRQLRELMVHINDLMYADALE